MQGVQYKTHPLPFEEWLFKQLRKYHTSEESLAQAVRLILSSPARREAWKAQYKRYIQLLKLSSKPAEELLSWIEVKVKDALCGDVDALYDVADVLQMRNTLYDEEVI